VGKPRHGKPDPFGHGARYSTTNDLADAAELSAAVESFVEAYVIKAKRERVLGKLLGPHRGDTLRGLIAVVDPRYQIDLEGSTGFPQHLEERFGDLHGVLIAERAAYRGTLVAACYKAKDLSDSCLFVAPQLAMFFPEVGPSTLIRRQLVAG
jgi:hypothetical protein